MAKDLRVSILIDVYGNILTDKQKDVIELYYNEDLSLAEIAEHEGITRQGVRDSIKRAETILTDVEEKLQFADIINKYSDAMDKIKVLAGKIYNESSTYNYSRVITDSAKKILECVEENDEIY